jgi:hypothetical protein
MSGLGRSSSWRFTVGIARAAAVLRLALGEFVVEPLGTCRLMQTWAGQGLADDPAFAQAVAAVSR